MFLGVSSLLLGMNEDEPAKSCVSIKSINYCDIAWADRCIAVIRGSS